MRPVLGHLQVLVCIQLAFVLTLQSFRIISNVGTKELCYLHCSWNNKLDPDIHENYRRADPRITRSCQLPRTRSESSKSTLKLQLKPLIMSTLYALYSGVRPAVASEVDYQKMGFKLSIPDGWTILPRKLPTASFSQYMSEEILLVASNFVEGVSLSVTKSNAQRLLKDFNIDWWFDKISTIEDVGNSDLISKLLILQRQGNFDGKSPSAASLLSSSLDKHILSFVFEMPVAEGVARKTLTKSFFKDGYLYSLWISGLDSIFDGEYGAVVKDIQNSFVDARNGS